MNSQKMTFIQYILEMEVLVTEALRNTVNCGAPAKLLSLPVKITTVKWRNTTPTALRSN